ncbi:glucose-methanol-choline oxidoreductase [Coleophoma cylindrospora]|uniref:Glucose-methanol-choline oxidoreductase n=1 Tax=Coleophoma cylindrospora TaxID=1849047 RepID=A0A3D8QFK0_9HELO|nr:glucose-methanol-choline oxidoreductase [Coleophoma cylindrospora]
MYRFLKFLWLLAAVQAAPSSYTRDQGLIGSSFGVPGNNATFDYIIVGGGTAGLTLATRLAEQQKGRVAVIEAGSFYEIGNGNISQVPAGAGAYSGKAKDDWQPLVDWGYITTPQPGAYGDEIHYPRGKYLGGSSARNYMVYQRGTRASYQRWADAVGDQSYTFDQLLPYFEKSLRFTPPNMGLRFANGTPEYDPTVLGNGSGPLSVTFSHYVQAFATWATRGLQAIGIPVIKGFQSGSLLGQSYSMFTIDATTMIRDSSETSFLRRALAYPNYSVYQSTMAKKILFDTSKKATGVVVDTQGRVYTLSATKEVIVSAGVFGSPQLLMASGIGPAAALQQHGIPVIADRPGVGQNMQDHIFFGPSYRVNAPTASSFSNPAFAAQAAKDFNERAAGMYTNPAADVIAWEKVPQPLRSTMSKRTLAALATYPADWPELEYISVAAYLGFQESIATGDPGDGFNYASLAVALCTPRSRGNLTITSADTAVAPLINPNWLTDSADMEVAIAGFKRARQFWQSKAMQPFVIGREAFPGLQVQSDAQIEDIIRKSFNTVYHAACTCSMGRSDDKMAVVDTKARVYGVQGLRVVDAAAFPILPPGHPQSTVYALAEKIAFDITGGRYGTSSF